MDHFLLLQFTIYYISKRLTTKTLLPGERIYTNLVRLITSIGYNGSKYGLFLINDELHIIIRVRFKNKNQIKITQVY